MKGFIKLINHLLRRIFSAEFIKFNIVGGIGVIVNMVAYIILKDWLSLHYMVSGGLAMEIHLSRLLGMGVTLGALYILVDIFNINKLLAYLIAIGLGVLTNFYTSDVYVWSKK